VNDSEKEAVKTAPWPRINTLSVAGYILGIAGVFLLLISVSVISSPAGNSGRLTSQPYIADNISISELTTGSAIISFTTQSPQVIDALVYDGQGKIIGVFSDSIPLKNHVIKIETLFPDSVYSFQLLSADASGSRSISEKRSFTTLKPPPVISNVQLSKTGESAVRITWETDKPAVTELSYWEEGDIRHNIISENTAGTGHSAIIQPLDSRRIYAFMIRATNTPAYQTPAVYEGLISLSDGARIIQRAPDFTLPTVSGENLQLSRYRGKVVLLAFWSMNCPSCQKKILLLQEAYKRAGSDRVSIISVHGPAREEAIKSYCSNHGLTLPVLLDLQADVGSKYNVIQLPATFILDQSGVIRSVNPEFESLEELDRLTGQFLPGTSGSNIRD
jgi:peroxiredoxin